MEEKDSTRPPDEPDNWTISIRLPGRPENDASTPSTNPRIEDDMEPTGAPPEEFHVPPQMSGKELTPEQRLMQLLGVDPDDPRWTEGDQAK